MIKVVDLFAGPGGLGEGFSSYRSRAKPRFKLAVSAEMDPAAHETLRLRAYLRRHADTGEMPSRYQEFLAAPTRDSNSFFAGEAAWRDASEEAMCLTLGERTHNDRLYSIIEERIGKSAPWILIGGPPCQAYSVVGRARRRGNVEYRPEKDHRHFLYKEYLHILDRYRPEAFVMENVRGILSSSVGGSAIFNQILEDLSDPGRAIRGRATSRYKIFPIAQYDAEDREADAGDGESFIIYSERHGVPQSRHRVILLGVREDAGLPAPKRLSEVTAPTVRQALIGLPPLRSGISDQIDSSPSDWNKALDKQRRRLIDLVKGENRAKIVDVLRTVRFDKNLERGGTSMPSRGSVRGMPPSFQDAVADQGLGLVLNHETRSHMVSDLGRYLFCAAFAQAVGRSPKSHDFPKRLAPDHISWGDGSFKDRFRVHVPNAVAGTITSHISKDGHHFIHHDPEQCRSFTVREAARIQTFPDNYFFCGNRTQQYTQVGNAVPPVLARQIADVVAGMFAGRP